MTMTTTLTLLALLGSTARAEEPAPPMLSDGARVRLRVEGARKDDRVITGRLVSTDDLALTVLPDGGKQPVRVERLRVERLEVSRGRKRQTLQGLAGGVILGAATVAVAATLPQDAWDLKVAGIFLAGGFVVGGTLSGALNKDDRWQRVEAPRGRFGLTAAPDGNGVGAALRITF
jgi:hypothetical protein